MRPTLEQANEAWKTLADVRGAVCAWASDARVFVETTAGAIAAALDTTVADVVALREEKRALQDELDALRQTGEKLANGWEQESRLTFSCASMSVCAGELRKALANTTPPATERVRKPYPKTVVEAALLLVDQWDTTVEVTQKRAAQTLASEVRVLLAEVERVSLENLRLQGPWIECDHMGLQSPATLKQLWQSTHRALQRANDHTEHYKTALQKLRNAMEAKAARWVEMFERDWETPKSVTASTLNIAAAEIRAELAKAAEGFIFPSRIDALNTALTELREAAEAVVDDSERVDDVLMNVRADAIMHLTARSPEAGGSMKRYPREVVDLVLEMAPRLFNEAINCLAAEVHALRDELAALRPEVRAFALLMEEQLRRNDHKGGWQRDSATALLLRLREETIELARAIGGEGNVGKEAADVANFAMMITDVSGALDTQSEPKAGPREQLSQLRSSLQFLLDHEVDSIGDGEIGGWMLDPEKLEAVMRKFF